MMKAPLAVITLSLSAMSFCPHIAAADEVWFLDQETTLQLKTPHESTRSLELTRNGQTEVVWSTEYSPRNGDYHDRDNPKRRFIGWNGDPYVGAKLTCATLKDDILAVVIEFDSVLHGNSPHHLSSWIHPLFYTSAAIRDPNCSEWDGRSYLLRSFVKKGDGKWEVYLSAFVETFWPELYGDVIESVEIISQNRYQINYSGNIEIKPFVQDPFVGRDRLRTKFYIDKGVTSREMIYDPDEALLFVKNEQYNRDDIEKNRMIYSETIDSTYVKDCFILKNKDTGEEFYYVEDSQWRIGVEEHTGNLNKHDLLQQHENKLSEKLLNQHIVPKAQYYIPNTNTYAFRTQSEYESYQKPSSKVHAGDEIWFLDQETTLQLKTPHESTRSLELTRNSQTEVVWSTEYSPRNGDYDDRDNPKRRFIGWNGDPYVGAKLTCATLKDDILAIVIEFDSVLHGNKPRSLKMNVPHYQFTGHPNETEWDGRSYLLRSFVKKEDGEWEVYLSAFVETFWPELYGEVIESVEILSQNRYRIHYSSDIEFLYSRPTGIAGLWWPYRKYSSIEGTTSREMVYDTEKELLFAKNSLFNKKDIKKIFFFGTPERTPIVKDSDLITDKKRGERLYYVQDSVWWVGFDEFLGSNNGRFNCTWKYRDNLEKKLERHSITPIAKCYINGTSFRNKTERDTHINTLLKINGFLIDLPNPQ